MDVGAAQGIDFSMTALFLRATITVQLVMLALLAASFWSWAVVVGKWMGFRKVEADCDQFEAAFWSGQPLDELHERLGPNPHGAMERVFVAGMDEWQKSHDETGHLIPRTQERIDRAMNVALTREAGALETRLGYLATTGSIAPFVGLFGTVWGIKTAFEDIALMQSTNLAVVAPGIAEALVATALGLFAAIPAVIFYNKLSGDTDRINTRMENFADQFGAIMSRQLERQ